MTLVIQNKESFPNDAVPPEQEINSRSSYSRKPMAAVTSCYILEKQRYDEGGWDFEDLRSKVCYAGWNPQRYVQFIPTYRPRTLVMIAEFLGNYLPPDMQETEVIVRMSEMSIETGPLAKYPYVVEIEYDYPEQRGTYPQRAWLTWMSWLRAGWEFLSMDTQEEDALGFFLATWRNGPGMSNIHYALYSPTTTGQIDRADVLVLLEKLTSGAYNNGSHLQKQALVFLGKREAVEEEEEEDDLDPDFGDFNDDWDDDEPVFGGPNCGCNMCRRRRGEIV